MDQREMFLESIRHVAKLCAVAAMTAPKSGGQLFLKGGTPYTRCQTRIAGAARHLGIIKSDLAVALSMSVSHKNIFFDKKTPEVTFNKAPPA